MSYETERMDALKYELSRARALQFELKRFNDNIEVFKKLIEVIDRQNELKAIELGIQKTNENNRYKHR